MLNAVIRFSLHNRALVLVLALFATLGGLYEATRLQVDVLPDLSRPRVQIVADCPGMAPEEIRQRVVVPIEMYLNGATGVTSIRSSTTAGLSLFTVEFAWGTDGFRCRQIVDERLRMSEGQLPEGVEARMVPMGSMMGRVMLLSVWDERGETTPMELRTLADWTLRPRLLGAGGVSEVLVVGGDVQQVQIRPRIDDLLLFGLTVEDIERAVADSNSNVTGGVATRGGTEDFLVRSLGRVQDVADFRTVVVNGEADPPVLLPQVADIEVAPGVRLGSSATWTKTADGAVRGGPSVVLSVEKQAGQDTRALTEAIHARIAATLRDLQPLHPGLHIDPVYQQQTFIQLAIDNVMEALWLGALLVVVVLVMFLMNLRSTLITVLAMPLSILMTCICFAWFGMSINTLTLGGIAVAIGELVDDAIVDVENIFRRLREHFRQRADAGTGTEPPAFTQTLRVVFEASSEIRNSIVNGTLVVVLAFLPVFFLTGMEGLMFRPLGIAYVVSLGLSLLVSLTVTPALASLLLPRSAARRERREGHQGREGLVLRGVQSAAASAIRLSLRFPRTVLAFSAVIAVASVVLFMTLERDFVPPFNEGAPTVNVQLPPGRSLAVTEQYSTELAQQLLAIPGVESVMRKTGRAEMDDHAVPVNMSELVCTLDLNSGRPITEVFAEIEAIIAPANVPGMVAYYDQPLQHLMGHLRTGTSAKLAIKVRGEDPLLLRRRALEIQSLISDIPGIGTPFIEPMQQDLPQLRVTLDRERLAGCGLNVAAVNHLLETTLHGRTVTQLLEGTRTVDVVVRLPESEREDWSRLARLPVPLPGGGTVPLGSVARLDPHASGPAKINHEAALPQLTLQINPVERGASEVQRDVEARLAPHRQKLVEGNVHIEMAGLFQSERETSRRLLALSLVALVGIFMVLFRMFRSVNLVLQVLSALPLALFGAVVMILLTDQHRTIPNLVGMISLCGIATRNGILLLDHYRHLMEVDGEPFGKEMILHAGRDRTAPVLMTALTSSLGLIPLALTPSVPGREILYPIATVVVGGLLTSTLMEFFTRPALFWLFGGRNNKTEIK